MTMAKRAIQSAETGDQAYAKRQKLTVQSNELLVITHLEQLQHLLDFQQNEESVQKHSKPWIKKSYIHVLTYQLQA